VLFNEEDEEALEARWVVEVARQADVVEVAVAVEEVVVEVV